VGFLETVYFEGGDGSSLEQAVVIRGAESDAEGIAAEHAFVDEVFGPGCMKDRQSLSSEGGRWYDVLEILLPQGGRVSVYFDITEHFIGGLRGRLAAALSDDEAVRGVLDAPLAEAMAGKQATEIPPVVRAAGITAAVVVVGMALHRLFTPKRRAA
jgi:hypothetical protein